MFHSRIKSEVIPLENSLHITLGLGSMSCQNETGTTKKNLINDFLDQVFADLDSKFTIGNSHSSVLPR